MPPPDNDDDPVIKKPAERFEMLELGSSSLEKRIDAETQERILTTLTFYGRNPKGARACSCELERQGIKCSSQTLIRYQKTFAKEMDVLLRNNNAKLVGVPIFHRTVRLQYLQDILDDENVAVKDKLATLRLAKDECEDMNVLKKFNPESYEKLPPEVRKELEERAGKILDAEFNIVPNKVEEPSEELKKDMASIVIPSIEQPSHQGEIK